MPRKGENIFKRKDGRWEGRYIKTHPCERYGGDRAVFPHKAGLRSDREQRQIRGAAHHAELFQAHSEGQRHRTRKFSHTSSHIRDKVCGGRV